ncbi:hypothetical protein L195_g026183 [Trifolium pratense]|uniref:Transposase (putative) gypsy type domain-containing protein n=1 Tax=Trifolium pratense TaxID=57577 RepID=A0A2K3NIM1_TRIPR|nr:hypothetical protein L195_g026183 [Trifolium pratense]
MFCLVRVVSGGWHPFPPKNSGFHVVRGENPPLLLEEVAAFWVFYEERFIKANPICSFGFKMAEEQLQNPHQSSSRRVADYSWVADEPRYSVLEYADCEDDIPDEMCTDIQVPPTEDFEVQIPSSRQQICNVWRWGTVPMYEIAFKHLGFKLPFTDLEVSIFRHLRLAPSQLHPNSLGFIRAFELTADHLGLTPTLPLFFYTFRLQRSCPKGEKAKGNAPKGKDVPESKRGWVFLRQRKRFFEMYEESVRGFKEVYYGVRPITLKGWQNFVRKGNRIDENGKEELDD